MSRDEAQIATDWTHPVFQVRSQEKLDRLLAAGLTLVEKIPYAQLKIADIAAQADCRCCFTNFFLMRVRFRPDR